MRTPQLAALLTAALLIASTAACADKSDKPVTASTEAAATEAVETQPEYVYPDEDYEGADYRVLNYDQLWDMYIQIDVDEMTGDALDDAVYERNRAIEEKLNFKLRELPLVNTNNDTAVVTNEAQKVISAGDDAYDVMFLPINKKPSLITDGYLLDLAAMPELNFNETWWDNVINEAVTMNGHLYIASGAMQLMAFDSSWCLFFNEKIINDHSLAMPYDTVRDGKWTVDALYEYGAAVASLNGDGSYKWDSSGASLYGISTHPNSPDKFIYSCGELYVKNDGTGAYMFDAGNERYMNVAAKLSQLLGTEGVTFAASYTDFSVSEGGYYYVFSNNRSLFLTAEIKAAQLLRNMDDTFGIVPFPKYDETQEEYRTNLVSDLFYFTIPTTNKNVSRTATISEVLTYESYKRVFPIYYDVTVEQKGLRNDDSIEMLKIMRTTRGIDISVVFGWNDDLASAVRTKLYKGDSSLSSDISKYQKTIEKKMDTFFEFIG